MLIRREISRRRPGHRRERVSSTAAASAPGMTAVPREVFGVYPAKAGGTDAALVVSGNAMRAAAEEEDAEEANEEDDDDNDDPHESASPTS